MARRVAAALWFFLLFPRASWARKPLPPSPYNYVYNEGVVSSSMEDRLSRRLRGVEEQTGRQFVVALFRSLDGESVEEYANRLFKQWGVGAKKGDDGLLFVLFKEDRRWRVEVGYGLEGTLTDLEAADIVRSRSVSYFKDGDFDTGVFAAVDGLATRLGGTQTTRIRPRREPSGGVVILLTVLFILLALFLLCFIYESVRSSTVGQRGRAASAALDVLSIVFNLLSLFAGGGGGSGGGGFSGGGGSSGGGGASGDW